MYATIRRYEHAGDTTEEVLRAGRQLAAGLSRAPGFVAYVLLEATGGGLAAVSIFETEAAGAAAEGLAAEIVARWDAGPRTGPLPRPPQVTGGEVVVQRGL